MEHWDGISFHSITSNSMGICLQLGHTSSVWCDSPLSAFNNNFIIIDYNGIYEVGLDFCGCASAQPHIIQLLCVPLFPATTVDPKTAVMFWALEYFQMLSFESKVSVFKFYKTAAHLTDNTGIHVPKDHYEAMLRMIREWRFIKQMQHVGKNLPDGWENAPSEIHHNAVNLVDTKVSHGLAATGAVGNLQNGKRYLNMDYLFFSSMQSSSDVSALNISYYITCQWNKHLWIYIFSFNFIKGVGHTDGEAPEHGWADINPIATRTCKMGPGSRYDTLDDHFNDLNWEKICVIDELTEWRKEIEAWEAEHSQPNPFEGSATTTMTQAAVCLALSTAEATEIEHSAVLNLMPRRLDNMLQMSRRASSYSRPMVQLLYMPGVSCLWSLDDIATEAKVHNISLYLPLSLPQYALLNLTVRLGKNDYWERSLKPLDKHKDAVPLKHNDD
ncbi:hypothetical protein F4604DRAFT_1688611 [Suillus subluteus]|nr:hypothetical protein F4604DRAFT_1688611 [Suillus subluteus]